jgi:hypothetical protein
VLQPCRFFATSLGQFTVAIVNIDDIIALTVFALSQLKALTADRVEALRPLPYRICSVLAWLFVVGNIFVVPTVWKLAKRQNQPCLCLDGLSATNNIQIHQSGPTTPCRCRTCRMAAAMVSCNSSSVVYLSGKTTGELVVSMHTDSGCYVRSHLRNLAAAGGPRDLR